MNKYSEADCQAMAEAWVSAHLKELDGIDSFDQWVHRIKADLMKQLQVTPIMVVDFTYDQGGAE